VGGGNEAPAAKGKAGQSQIGDLKVDAANGEGGVELSKDLPADVPIYPGSTVKMQALRGKGETCTGMLQLRTKNSVETVDAYYRKQLDAQGWTVPKKGGSLPGTANKLSTVMARKEKENRRLTAQIIKDKEGQTVVHLTLGRSPPQR